MLHCIHRIILYSFYNNHHQSKVCHSLDNAAWYSLLLLTLLTLGRDTDYANDIQRNYRYRYIFFKLYAGKSKNENILYLYFIRWDKHFGQSSVYPEINNELFKWSYILNTSQCTRVHLSAFIKCDWGKKTYNIKW